MTQPDPTAANIAIAKALGLDPNNICKGGVTLTLDGYLGPILTVKTFLRDSAGKRFAVNDEVATELSRYKLVPIDDDDTPIPPDPFHVPAHERPWLREWLKDRLTRR